MANLLKTSMIKSMKKAWIYLLPIIAGVFYATGFPMFGGITFILGPIIGFLFLNISLDHCQSLKQKLLISWLYSLGFYSFGYYWIPSLLKEFGDIYPPFNYILGLIFSFILLPQVYIYAIFKERFKGLFALALFYTLLEFFIPQQFPSHIGHPFMALRPTLALNFASIFGASFYSFLVAVLSLSIAQHLKTKKTPQFYYLFSILILIFSSINFDKKIETKDFLKIRLVQPNIGNFIKVDSEKGGSNSLKSVLDSYYDLSTANIFEKRDLIIWPETAFPTLLSSELMYKTKDLNTPPLIKRIIDNTQSEMLIGGYDFNLQSKNQFGFESDYNTAFYFSNQGTLKDAYHKMKLIPFGEGLPFGPFNKFLSQYITNVSFFAKGDRFTQFKLPNQYTFQTAICYEILFPNFIRDLLNGNETTTDFMINLTNDSWYGDTFEPYQHLFLAKWRAVEFNLPIIRSTNTGITTIIYPDGSESQRMMINEKKYLDINFPLIHRTSTLFQNFGIYLFILFGLILTYLEKTLLLKDREV